jgi:aspartyl/asparaginyl beta-hydroxylase (cupin superfamily)
VLRLHLGLIVPEPRDMLGIRVENEVYRWRKGEVVIFDDAYEHEAWNRTPHTRVVLFFDFRKPLSAKAWTTRRHGKRSSTPRHKHCGMARLPLFP